MNREGAERKRWWFIDTDLFQPAFDDFLLDKNDAIPATPFSTFEYVY
jgi:hypothetical protein